MEGWIVVCRQRRTAERTRRWSKALEPAGPSRSRPRALRDAGPGSERPRHGVADAIARTPGGVRRGAEAPPREIPRASAGSSGEGDPRSREGSGERREVRHGGRRSSERRAACAGSCGPVGGPDLLRQGRAADSTRPVGGGPGGNARVGAGRDGLAATRQARVRDERISTRTWNDRVLSGDRDGVKPSGPPRGGPGRRTAGGQRPQRCGTAADEGKPSKGTNARTGNRPASDPSLGRVTRSRGETP
jgi:hypothetical protein